MHVLFIVHVLADRSPSNQGSDIASHYTPLALAFSLASAFFLSTAITECLLTAKVLASHGVAALSLLDDLQAVWATLPSLLLLQLLQTLVSCLLARPLMCLTSACGTHPRAALGTLHSDLKIDDSLAAGAWTPAEVWVLADNGVPSDATKLGSLLRGQHFGDAVGRDRNRASWCRAFQSLSRDTTRRYFDGAVLVQTMCTEL